MEKNGFPINGVHLDLKCQWLSLDFVKEIIRTIAELGANTLLIELEDRFPFKRHPRLRTSQTFTEKEYCDILAEAKRSDLQVIPLVQTIGHAEYVLRHPEYAHLREIPEKCFQYCPQKRGSVTLIKDLLTDVIEKHPESQYIHLGADEPADLGACPACARVARKQGRAKLYVDHMVPLVDFLLSKNRVPIIWGDALLQYPDAMDAFPRSLVVMDWDYRPTRARDVLKHAGILRDKRFDVIIAPAVRCSGDSYLAPDYRLHIPNIVASVQAARQAKALGLVTTSWAIRRTPWDTTWYGIFCGIKLAQSRVNLPAMQIKRLFTQEFYGAAAPELIEVFELLSEPIPQFTESYPAAQEDGSWPKIIRAEEQLGKLRDGKTRVWEQLARLRNGKMWEDLSGRLEHIEEKAKKAAGILKTVAEGIRLHRRTLAVWELAAMTMLMKVKTVRLYDCLLPTGDKSGDPSVRGRLPSAFSTIGREVSQLTHLTTEVMGRQLTTEGLEAELAARFGDEHRLLSFYHPVVARDSAARQRFSGASRREKESCRS